MIETTVGRVIFSEIWPEELGFPNKVVGKSQLGDVIWRCYKFCGHEKTVHALDKLKEFGFREATRAGERRGLIADRHDGVRVAVGERVLLAVLVAGELEAETQRKRRDGIAAVRVRGKERVGRADREALDLLLGARARRRIVDSAGGERGHGRSAAVGVLVDDGRDDRPACTLHLSRGIDELEAHRVRRRRRRVELEHVDLDVALASRACREALTALVRATRGVAGTAGDDERVGLVVEEAARRDGVELPVVDVLDELDLRRRVRARVAVARRHEPVLDELLAVDLRAVGAGRVGVEDAERVELARAHDVRRDLERLQRDGGDEDAASADRDAGGEDARARVVDRLDRRSRLPGRHAETGKGVADTDHAARDEVAVRAARAEVGEGVEGNQLRRLGGRAAVAAGRAGARRAGARRAGARRGAAVDLAAAARRVVVVTAARERRSRTETKRRARHDDEAKPIQVLHYATPSRRASSRAIVIASHPTTSRPRGHPPRTTQPWKHGQYRTNLSKWSEKVTRRLHGTPR